MNPLNKTAVITPTVRQEAERKIPTTPSPVIQSSLASQIPTHQVSLGAPRSLSSYAVTQVAVESTEAKASRSSSSSSSSRPSRIISSASSSPSPLDKAHQGVQIHPEELEKLLNRSRISQEERAAVYRELEARMSEVVNAATTTNPAQPAVRRLALGLLANLAAISDVRAAELWTSLGDAGRATVVATATNPAQPTVAVQALGLLCQLTTGSDVRAAELWTALGAAGRAAIVTAATNPAQPAVAEEALYLLRQLTANSDVRRVELWATLGAAGRAAVVTAATTPAQPVVAEEAMLLLRNLTNLTVNSDGRAAELWANLGAAGRAAVVTAATTPAQPAIAEYALSLLTHLAANSEFRKAELWAILGAAGRAAVAAAATPPAPPAVAGQALGLLAHLVAYSDLRKADLWATLGAAGRKGLIIAATTAGESEVTRMAIQLLQLLKVNPRINAAIWPLLQPRLAQLWAVTQRPAVKKLATDFLFEKIRGDAQRTRQALNALNAAIPAVSMRHAITTLRQWGERVSRHEPEQTALLTDIVQVKTTPQKLTVFMTAVMSGIALWQRPLGEREALRDQVLAIPMAEGIDPTPYRQGIRLGFEAACGNTSAALDSQHLSAPEKLQLLEILYSSRRFLSAQLTHEELSKIRLMPNTSRDFKLQVIGLILNHGHATGTQFKENLAWLTGEFKTDPHTVFTNPATLGDIGDEAIYALTEQRQQYLSLYQNFRPHMTRDFIQTEIAEINQQVTTKKMPEDFGKTLIFQLRQFLTPAVIGATVKDDGRYDSKSESK